MEQDIEERIWILEKKHRELRDHIVSVLLTSSDPAIVTATSRTVTSRKRAYFYLVSILLHSYSVCPF